MNATEGRAQGPTPAEGAAADEASELGPAESPGEFAVDSGPGDSAGALPEEPVLIPPRGLVAVLLLALAFVAVAGVRWPFAVRGDSAPDMTLQSWRDGVEERTAWRDGTLRQHPQLPEEATIVTGFEAWLDREAALGEGVAEDADARRLRGQAEEQLRLLGLRAGSGAVMAAALRFGVATRSRLEGRGAQEDSADPPAGGLGATIRRAGLDRQRESGLGGAAWEPAIALLVEALAAERYLELALRLPPPRPELPTPWRRAWLAARVERSGAGLGLERRLALLDELVELDPSYPRSFATGVILAQEGRWRAARAAFVAAAIAGERPDAARANARWAAHHLPQAL